MLKIIKLMSFILTNLLIFSNFNTEIDETINIISHRINCHKKKILTHNISYFYHIFVHIYKSQEFLF